MTVMYNYILAIALLASGSIVAQNVGIGTPSPAALLHIRTQPGQFNVVPTLRLEQITANQGVALEMFAPVTQGLAQLVYKNKLSGYVYQLAASRNGAADYNILTIRPSSQQTGEFTNGGFVGINLQGTLPEAPLHVRGVSSSTSPTNIRYFNSQVVGITTTNNWTGSAAVFVEGNVCATEAFIAAQSFTFSDTRLKRILGKTNSKEDLAKINQLEVTRYTALDTFAQGNTVHTKIIAQQAKEIIPEAVKQTRAFLPNIMQHAAQVSATAQEGMWLVQMPEPQQVVAGDFVKCIDDTGREIYVAIAEVLSTNAFTVTGAGSRIPARLFVYGRQVHDVHMVDYEAISMLNVSATQQLSKELEAAKTEIEALKMQLKILLQAQGATAQQ